MALFKFNKKKDAPCCGGSAPSEQCCDTAPGNKQNINARFIVLGACCKKSADTFNNVRQAVNELGFTDEVVNIGDALEIAKYGIMQTPALVVDGKVVSYGKLLMADDVKKIFEKLGIK